MFLYIDSLILELMELWAIEVRYLPKNKIFAKSERGMKSFEKLGANVIFEYIRMRQRKKK